MPNTDSKFALLLLLALASHTTAEEVIEFDVPTGKYEELFAGQLTPDFMVTCRFALEHVKRGHMWYSYLAISFNSTESSDDDPWDSEYVSLWAYRTFASDFIGAPEHWHYNLSIRGADYRNSEQISSENGREPVHTLTLALSTENTILFLTGDDPEDTSLVEIPSINFKRWQAIASGLKGKARCMEN